MSEWSGQRTWQLRYGLAVVSVILSLVLTLLLWPLLGRMPGVLFFAAIMLSSWYGGLRPGVVATVLSVLSISYFLSLPLFKLSDDLANLLQLSGFALVALLISWLNAARIQVAKKLRQNESRFRWLLEDVKDYAIFFLDLDGRVVQWGTGAQRILGYQEAEILGKSGSCIFTPEDRKRGEDKQELRTAATEGRAEDERWHLRKDGSRFWGSGIVTPLYDEKGYMQGFSKIMRDLTDRKLAVEEIRQDNENLENRVRERTVELSVANEQVRREIQEREQTQAELHQSEEQYRQLVELCPDAIFIQSDGLFVFVNSAAVKLFGAKSREELIGRGVLDLVHPEYRKTVNERIEQLKQQKSVELIEEKFLRLDGSAIDVEVAAAPLTYQNQPASQVIARDISPRKQAEAELRKSLETERELSELKSRIIAVISHEYRTPLTTIQSSAELLENYGHKWTDEKKLIHLKRIQTSTKHMTNLVSDVLFIGQVEAHHIEFNPTSLDVEQFCRELVEQISSGQKSQTTITFSSQGNCTDGCLDERLLRQILSNLLSNAIKYSPQSDTVRFNLECLDGVVRFSIQDSGIGIPAAEVPSLFESFHRASNVGTIPGTGLGLAIVKKCVDLHNGQITVESEVGVGTTFTVTLPLKPTVSVSEEAENSSTNTASQSELTV